MREKQKQPGIWRAFTQIAGGNAMFSASPITAVDTSISDSFLGWDLDFNSIVHDASWRGAYSGGGSNPGWLPQLDVKKS